MGELQVEIEPGEVGFSADRLARIEQHFARYVDDGLITGFQVAVTRHGQVAYVANHGCRDREDGLPIEPDTIFRIYSMTKPITSVAAMMLYEEGAFELKDPGAAAASRRSRDQPRVRERLRREPGDRAGAPSRCASGTCSPTPPGLTYGFHHAHPVDAHVPRTPASSGAARRRSTSRRPCDVWAGFPLLFQPGTEWNYSVSTDVLGRRRRGRRRASRSTSFLAERIFEPLGMTDTGVLRAAEARRTTASPRSTSPTPHAARRALRRPGRRRSTPPGHARRAAAGWCRTAADYHRFTQMLRGGGELDGVRLLGPRTVAYMTANHLPGGADLEAFGRPLFAETTFDGVGFGLGFSVVDDPAASKVLSSRGEYCVGRRGQHRLLGRPGRGHHRRVHHPAAAVEHLADPLPAQAARLPGPRRLTSSGRGGTIAPAGRERASLWRCCSWPSAVPTPDSWQQAGQLALALLLTGLIGFERELRHKSAGLRTHATVGLSAALMTQVSKYGFSDVLGVSVRLDPSRVASLIVSGVGFLGAGIIFVRRDAVKGLTTAAVVWLSAGIGMACGAGLGGLAAFTTVGYGLIAFLFTGIESVMPAPRRVTFDLTVRYLARSDALGAVIAACTGRGQRIDQVGHVNVPAIAGGPPYPDDDREVEVRLTVRGPRPDHVLVRDIAALDGVLSVDLDIPDMQPD